MTRLLIALGHAACRRVPDKPGQPVPSPSEAASATLASILEIFSIFLFPVPEYGVDWNRQDDLQHGFSFVQALVDVVKDVFLKEFRKAALDQLWRWWINKGIVADRGLVSCTPQQTLFELPSWLDLPWSDASIETSAVAKEVIKLFTTFPLQVPQPYVYAAVSVVCNVIRSRASDMDTAREETIKSDLLAIYELLICASCSLPWPLGLAIDKLINDVIGFLPWSKLPPLAIASSSYTSKYILEFFNNQAERSFLQLIPIGALSQPSKAASIAVSSSDIHQQMALRLFTAIRVLRHALCWSNIPAETRPQAVLSRLPHYSLFIDLMVELMPRSFSTSFGTEIAADIFASIGKAATLLYSSYQDGQSEDHQIVTENIMRMTVRILSVINVDFNLPMVDIVETAALNFVDEVPSLSLLVLRAASLSYVFQLSI